jgi:alpha-L-rhamnosidase
MLHPHTLRFTPQQIFWERWLVFLVSLLALAGVSVSFFKAASASHSKKSTYLSYLPTVTRPDTLALDTPIWPHGGVSGVNEVALFRLGFTISETLEKAEVHLFADTRYEIWLDGNWLGRGPARFTYSLREYDIYSLNTLPAGEHVLAVLVQWAPNNRRSASVRPLLQGHLEGYQGSTWRVLARTSRDWKAVQSTAWNSSTVLVHAWGLIGPTEMLDLSMLPPDWYQPGYADDTWGNAIPVNPYQGSYTQFQVPELDRASSTLDPTPELVTASISLNQISYQPRSIPFLVDVPIATNVIDGGLLSPDFALGQFAPNDPSPSPINFRTTSPVTFTVELLSPDHPPMTDAAQLDGKLLDWEVTSPSRPDVYQTQVALTETEHSLVFNETPPEGLAFNISTNQVEDYSLPVELGIHTGLRLLLDEPVSIPEIVVKQNTEQLSLTFPPQPAYVVLDLGRTIHGRLSAQVSGLAGTVVDIGWDERLLVGTKRPLPFPGSLHPEWNQVDTWVLDGTTRPISTLDTRSGRYIMIAVWGNAPVSIQDIQIVEERLPLIQKAEFESPDPQLNRIWQTGVDTVYPNMTDAYTDTPWRERGQWWGDAYVIDHINRIAFGETNLLRRGLIYMAGEFSYSAAPGAAPNSNGTHMLDYAMLWVNSLAEYGRLTADQSLLIELYPSLITFMQHLASYTDSEEEKATGLIDLPYLHWSQIAYIEPLADNSRYGQSTAINALYYHTLLEAAWIAQQIGDQETATLWEKTASALRDSINSHLYLPSEHRYLTTIYQDVPESPTPQAQAWALAYEIPTANEAQAVGDSLLDLLSPDPEEPNVEAYGMFWVLESLGRTGRISEGLSLIQSFYGRLLDLGATTWWEGFNSDLSYKASLSHGWSGAPTWFLTTYLLGARQVGPFTWQVRPAFDSFDRIEGSLPLPQGDLQVGWKSHQTKEGNSSCQIIQMNINAPTETQGKLILPANPPPLFATLNDTPIWDGQGLVEGVFLQTDGLFISLGAGSSTVKMTLSCP